jgi:ABC-type branched-subunit amino acid transport system substrate-binding protein
MDRILITPQEAPMKTSANRPTNSSRKTFAARGKNYHCGITRGNRIMNHFKLLACTLVLTAMSTVAHAEDGVTKTEIVIGMSNALTGPAAGLGTGVKAGATAYINKVNAAGGVNGRKIKLVSYDDGYEPDQAAAMTNKLIEQDKVFALFGYVGTPTSTAVLPAASKAGVPYIAPFTGAEFLRNPINKIVYNVRASYFDETEGMVERLTKDLGIKKIGLFIQDDAYGNAGKAGVSRALAKMGLTPVGEGKYKRNTVDVDAALATLKAADPEAVVMVGTYKACAAFVKKAKASGFNPKFLNVSFVGTANFIKEAGTESEGVYITQVVPSPADASLPMVKQYQADMKSEGSSDFDFTSLEGHVDAVVLVEALRKAGTDLSRASFLTAFESLSLDLGGLKVAYSPTNHQGIKTIFYTVVKDGKAMSITKF